MKRLFSLITAFVLVIALAAVLPESFIRAKALGNITGLYITPTNQYISWDTYEGAAYYKVAVTSSKLNTTYKATNTKLDVSDKFQKGILYEVAVTAYNSYNDALTRPATGYYANADKITGVKIDKDLNVSWDAFDGDNEEYSINIILTSGGTGGTSAAKDQTSQNIAEDIAAEPSGRMELWVSAGVDIGYHVTTAKSEKISFDYVNPNTFITSTKATVSAPVPGTKPGFTANYVINGGAVKADDCIKEYSIQWVDVATNKLVNKDSVFEEGKRYKATIYVILKDGYYLDRETAKYKDMTSSINGISTYMFNTGGFKGYDFSVEFKPTTVLNKVDVSLTEPKAGEPRVTNATTSTTGAKLEARVYSRRRWVLVPNVVIWYSGANAFVGQTYVKDNIYTAQIRLLGDEGYAITKDTKVYANGKQATFDSYDETGAAIFTIDYDLRDRIPGDVNGDGAIDIKDVTVLKQYLAKWNVTINKSNADVTGDGDVTVKDLTLLKQHLAKWNVVLK